MMANLPSAPAKAVSSEQERHTETLWRLFQEMLRIRDLEIDTRRHKATRAGTPLNLTAKEFLLLTHLVRSAGQVISRAEIASHVWDINFATNTNVVDVMVRRLRAKVDDPFQPKLIHTVRGAGYVLKAG